MSSAMPTISAADILDFWFTECSEEDWFKKSDAFDATLRDRFGTAHEAAAQGQLDGWAETADGRLALILLLDQMSRNLFRGSARAFAQDPAALALARRAIAEGDHVGATRERRLFLYLPFEHSENPADQALCLALFVALGDDGLTDYADRHKVIVDRFGRFPHRNEVLGRESTPAERAFLQEPNSSF
ncbi:DUF924 family protein [Thalassobaculum salexigens]|uniref:DUF924 family protein n=1 Tax=Thalassobaculum salexigens TaxID=455360 RepID=UPI000A03ED9B|nr:DUF924 family protein [Thalassobaculum salexigens]